MRVLVAMSGGVDSSVSALLLKEQGHEVIGGFMRMGKLPYSSNPRSCCSLLDSEDAQRVAGALDIPLYIFNFEEEFRELISYFCREYDQGRTPNPCILCNRKLKFEALLRRAESLGCDRLVTGHYARLQGTEEGPRLFRGIDRVKDQSYVLFDLAVKQLERAIFPLGKLSKEQVREIASHYALPIKDKLDSQEVCFVSDHGYKRLFDEYLEGRVRPGPIVDSSGRVCGTHEGYQFYTIGQRKGLGAFGKRIYVTRILPESNTILVGEDSELYQRRFVVSDINWIAPDIRRDLKGEFQFGADVQIRSQHKASPAMIKLTEPERAEVSFDEPQRAITPGQASVFYRGDEVLGGGWIDRVLPE